VRFASVTSSRHADQSCLERQQIKKHVSPSGGILQLCVLRSWATWKLRTAVKVTGLPTAARPAALTSLAERTVMHWGGGIRGRKIWARNSLRNDCRRELFLAPATLKLRSSINCYCYYCYFTLHFVFVTVNVCAERSLNNVHLVLRSTVTFVRPQPCNTFVRSCSHV
jgi:hypothetical protein